MNTRPITTALAGLALVAAGCAAPAGGTAGGDFGARVVDATTSQLGTPYTWGGGGAGGPGPGLALDASTDPPTPARAGFDASGLVQYAVATASGGAVTLPRDAAGQAAAGTAVAPGTERPGDVVAAGDPVHDVAVYTGEHDGRRWVVASGAQDGQVHESTIDDWLAGRPATYRRMG